jgi:hypothetical protein
VGGNICKTEAVHGSAEGEVTVKLIAVAGFMGTAIPSVWMALYHGSPAFARWWIEAPSYVEIARLLLWPTSLLLIADPFDENVALGIASIALNAVVYVTLAGLFLAPKSRCKPSGAV